MSSSLILDCDGVILDSNKLKTDIFINICQKYQLSPDNTKSFILYHKENGGVSRFQKISVLHSIISNSLTILNPPSEKQLLDEFTQALDSSYKNSPFTEGFQDFLREHRYNNIFVISGSEQYQLRSVFESLGILDAFTEVLGSPITKFNHLANLLSKYPNTEFNGFVGDSLLDYQVAESYSIPFYFLSTYSECPYLKKMKLQTNLKFKTIYSLSDLL